MRRNGFTLVELIVSVGILSIMVTISSWVFSLTLDSTGQANALMEVTHACKSVERQMREELANVPGDSVMVIHPHIVNAWWTEQEKEVDANGLPYETAQPSSSDLDHVEYTSDEFNSGQGAWIIRSVHEMPRADVLMFFTATPARSQTTGTRSNMQMVTYGHANLGKIDASSGVFSASTPFEGNSYYIEQQDGTARADRAMNAVPYPVPASEWHLARKAVVISNQIESNACADASDADLLEGIKDILAPTGTGTSNETIPGFLYSRDVENRTFTLDPTLLQTLHSEPIGIAATWSGGINASEYQDYRWWNRPRLDLQPPASRADRVGAYMLSNCASFKVEWTFDSPGFVHMKDTPWFDTAVRVPASGYSIALFPGIALPLARAGFSLTTSGLDATQATEIVTILQTIYTDLHNRVNSLALSGIGGIDPQEDGIAIFYPKIQQHSAAPVETDPYFPTALRITMEVYDSSGRLDKPIKHTMVLPVGNQ